MSYRTPGEGRTSSSSPAEWQATGSPEGHDRRLSRRGFDSESPRSLSDRFCRALSSIIVEPRSTAKPTPAPPAGTGHRRVRGRGNQFDVGGVDVHLGAATEHGDVQNQAKSASADSPVGDQAHHPGHRTRHHPDSSPPGQGRGGLEIWPRRKRPVDLAKLLQKSIRPGYRNDPGDPRVADQRSSALRAQRREHVAGKERHLEAVPRLRPAAFAKGKINRNLEARAGTGDPLLAS